VFTVRYALSPYIKQIRFVFKGLICSTHPDHPNTQRRERTGKYCGHFARQVTNQCVFIFFSQGSVSPVICLRRNWSTTDLDLFDFVREVLVVVWATHWKSDSFLFGVAWFCIQEKKYIIDCFPSGLFAGCPLKPEIHLNTCNIQNLLSYLRESTLRVHYKTPNMQCCL
jgi:hypothetical protein